MSNLPKLSRALLYPRYQLLWLRIDFLWLPVQLPYPVTYRLRTAFGRLAVRVMKGCVRTTRHDLGLRFPEMSAVGREVLLAKDFESLGMGLVGTDIARFQSTHRMMRWTGTSGVNEVVGLLEQRQGILLIGIHFLILKVRARMHGTLIPDIGVYRLSDNPLIDWLRIRGRLRSNRTMSDRESLKGMIRALKEGEIPWHAPDHDYGPANSISAPLFTAEQAAITTGTWMLAKMPGAMIVPFVPQRKPNGIGYELIPLTPECTPPLVNAEATVAQMNQIIEQCILMAPRQYMWLYRRLKTHPEGVPPRH